MEMGSKVLVFPDGTGVELIGIFGLNWSETSGWSRSQIGWSQMGWSQMGWTKGLEYLYLAGVKWAGFSGRSCSQMG